MESSSAKTAEHRILSVGFFLSGLAIVLTGVSYFLYMKFTYQWLVWIIAAAFVAIGFLTMIWPKGNYSPDKRPEGKFRLVLLLSMPLAFLLSSQVCGLGFRACNLICHITNLLLIMLAAVTAIRVHKDQRIDLILIPMIVIALIPHCVCHAPINVLWHSILGGYAPTCEMIPLAALLFSVSALRGLRPHISAAIIVVLFAVMLFIIAGGLFFGFPWQGCVDHPRITG
jgi:hypothetical protein